MSSRTSATTCPADIGICEDKEEFEASCRTVFVFGSFREVFRGAGICTPFSTNGRPVDCVAAPNGGPVPEGRRGDGGDWSIFNAFFLGFGVEAL
jgi:hypothetical protein